MGRTQLQDAVPMTLGQEFGAFTTEYSYRELAIQYLHPNNDINMSQSTNDVYPTAIRLGLLLSLDELNLPFNNLILSFRTNLKNLLTS